MYAKEPSVMTASIHTQDDSQEEPLANSSQSLILRPCSAFLTPPHLTPPPAIPLFGGQNSHLCGRINSSVWRSFPAKEPEKVALCPCPTGRQPGKPEDSDSRQIRVGNSLAVQWLGLGAFTAGAQGSIPGQGSKILQAERRGRKKKIRVKKENLGLPWWHSG